MSDILEDLIDADVAMKTDCERNELYARAIKEISKLRTDVVKAQREADRHKFNEFMFLEAVAHTVELYPEFLTCSEEECAETGLLVKKTTRADIVSMIRSLSSSDCCNHESGEVATKEMHAEARHLLAVKPKVYGSVHDQKSRQR